MNSNQVAADFAAMETAVQQFNNNVTNLETAIANVSSAVSNLETVWKGKGSYHFQQASLDWNKASTDIKATLSEIGLAIGESKTQYESVESAISKAFQGFQA